MRISHIAMYVRDLEVVKEFYIRFFGAKAGELYHNPKTGLKSYFLSFDEGTRLELMNLPEMQDQKKVLVRMGYIHIAISVGSREKVDAITEKLYEAGYDVLSGAYHRGWLLREHRVRDRKITRLKLRSKDKIDNCETYRIAIVYFFIISFLRVPWQKLVPRKQNRKRLSVLRFRHGQRRHIHPMHHLAV